MTTVRELINYLETLPDDTEVMVLEETAGTWQVSTRFVPLNIGENTLYTEFNDNRELEIGLQD